MAKIDDLVQRRAKQVVLTIVARLAHRSLPDSESRRRRNHEQPKSGIPKRKKIAMHIGFLAKSITFSGQIMVSDQLLPNSSRATKPSQSVGGGFASAGSASPSV
jgi:hypothetical protein